MAERIMISSYKNFADTKDIDIEFGDFLDGIKSGKWQDGVLHVRTIADKTKRDIAKKKLPMMTISGSFTERKNSGLRKHSGFIAIDIDKIENPNTVKELLSSDPYIYASFISVSGGGLCLIFRIDSSRHLDAFDGIGAYLYDTYQLIIDPACKNVARTRFVSYDPYMVTNTGAILFKKYQPKKKVQKVAPVVFVKSDFDEIITQMYTRNVNVCESYQDWLTCAYALVSEFGETGRSYFHTLSSLSSKYNPNDTDKQFDACLNNHTESKEKKSTIGSIYHFAKQAGVDTYSATTKEVIRATASQAKNGGTKETIEAYLNKHHQIAPASSAPIIEQVISNNIEYHSDSIVDDIQSYLGAYSLRRNLISRNIEMNGKPIDDADINSMYIDIKSLNDKVSKDLITSVIFSNRTASYHPIKEMLAEYQGTPITEAKNLRLLLSSIKSTTPNYEIWITKWLIALIASAYGNYSPLTLVLCGEKQGTGKSHFFRYLLPKRLRNLYAESKMDAGKDDEILMTKKWIIVDDEYGGKSKKEYTKIKEITSKEFINVREPYGRVTVDLRRIAMFGGTSNIVQLLNDPTGNRRIVPVYVDSINRELYNACDKEMLLHELHAMYLDGYNYTILQSDIESLAASTEDFKQSNAEEELLHQKLAPGSGNSGEWWSITEIIQYLITNTKFTNLSNTRIGMLLSMNKYQKKRGKKDGSNAITLYYVQKTVAPYS